MPGAISIRQNLKIIHESPIHNKLRPRTTRNIIKRITLLNKDTTKNTIMLITIVINSIIMIIAALITAITLKNTLIHRMKITILITNIVTFNTATSTAMTNEPILARMSRRTLKILTDMVPKLKGPRIIGVASISGQNIISLPLTRTKTSNSPTKPLRLTRLISKAI